MTLLSKLFGQNKTEPPSTSPAHEVIRLARLGQITVKEMLDQLVCSKVYVPLAEPPKMDGQRLKSWKPATISKSDGSQWLVAFTSTPFMAEFKKQSPAHAFGLFTEANWVLQAMPPDHGLVFNIGSAEHLFEWSADGIVRYKHDVGA